MPSKVRQYFESVSWIRTGTFFLNRLWILLCFWGTLVYLSPEGPTSSVFNSVHGISNLTSAVMLFACGFACKPIERLLETRTLAFAPAVLASVGAAALAFSPSPTGETDLSMLVLLGSIATGLGSGAILVDIARQYENVPARTIALETTLAFALATIAYLCVNVLGSPVAIALALTTPFVIIALVEKNMRETQSETRTGSAKDEIPQGRHDGSSVDSRHDAPAGSVARKVSKPLTKLLAGIVLFSIPVEFMRGIYTQTQFDTFSDTFAFFLPLVTCLACLAVALYCLLSKEFRLGIFFKLMIPIVICGFMVAPLLSRIGALALALTSVGYCLFQILTWVLFANVSSRLSLSPVRVFGLGNGLMRSIGILTGSFVTLLATRHELGGNALTLISLFAVAFLAVTFLIAFTEKDLDQLSAALGNERTFSASDAPKKVPLKQRCDMIGHHYGLSPRECEIFRLLAIGRNAKAISEELCLARGTMNTHMRNIYRKMGVHSQQELIDIMQQTDLDELEECTTEYAG